MQGKLFCLVVQGLLFRFIIWSSKKFMFCCVSNQIISYQKLGNYSKGLILYFIENVLRLLDFSVWFDLILNGMVLNVYSSVTAFIILVK